ncbi:MAG: GPW/gp25 family protein [Myxococcales bacterium]|nr:GPW/gp25 family protein [Myxococcales bacterium]
MAGARKFLGTGWTSPLRFADGRLETASADDCVEQAIWAILETAPGERLMRPDFGCAIHDLVFETPSAALVGQINRAVFTALTKYEQRIEILGIEVIPDEESDNLLKIEIDYRLRSVNSRFSLVYPFYLGGGANAQ